MSLSGKSLDEQWLDFAAKADPVFARHPQMEPLRLFVFKELLTRGVRAGLAGHVKHWLRPLTRRERTRGPLRRADVLIWIESRREDGLEFLLPVYRELLARGITVQLVSYSGPASTPDSAADFRFPARAISPAWAKPAWSDLCDAVPELRSRDVHAFLHATANIQSMLDEQSRVLEIVRPKITLSGSTQLKGGAALTITSRAHGALSLLLQHGILQVFFTPLLADYMLTWGKSSDDFLAGLNIPRQRLVALGSPKHDSMVPASDDSPRKALLEALSLPDRPTFVFFSNGNDLVRNGVAPVECAQWLETAAAKYDGRVNVVVRLHPNEDGSLYRNCPHLKVVKGVPDLATTLDGCDGTGSLCSTVLYEALLYRKPVWQFYADGWPELADNWKAGLATRIASEADLVEKTGQMLNCGWRMAIPLPPPACGGIRGGGESAPNADLADYVFANHGCAAQAIADFIKNRLARQRTLE